jgi:hypothetical protein
MTNQNTAHCRRVRAMEAVVHPDACGVPASREEIDKITKAESDVYVVHLSGVGAVVECDVFGDIAVADKGRGVTFDGIQPRCDLYQGNRRPPSRSTPGSSCAFKTIVLLESQQKNQGYVIRLLQQNRRPVPGDVMCGLRGRDGGRAGPQKTARFGPDRRPEPIHRNVKCRIRNARHVQQISLPELVH